MFETMRRVPHPDRSDLELTEVLHALGDPVRMAVVRRLAAQGTLTSCQLHDGSVSLSTLTHHLRVLREAGITQTVLAGRERQVSLRREDLEARFPGVLESVLAADPRPAPALADPAAPLGR